ncbi:MAG: hypothetical protein Greene041662_3 [Candidatus Peregrinibacteria bacterium Greene0416_62]|nr:MAG: hypothetical protein Greene041662_3 [Candidatus Peregrinibacteria bacterium Greene0416_62]TSC97411.1 MAG: hypothetical protein Greene101449_1215 [Candidatus Peregrinibacteria bacterium Greene1014_49]
MGGRPCHLDCSGGELQWLPGAGVNNYAPCTPSARVRPIEPTSAGVPAEFGDTGEIPAYEETMYPTIPIVPGDTVELPTSPADFPVSPLKEEIEEYCPYINGCHKVCQGNRYRLRAGEGDNPEGVSEGDPCISPPSEMRPSIFSKIVSGIQRLFYRPQ